MKINKLVQNIVILVFISNIIHAGCGSCESDVVKTTKVSLKASVSNALIMSVPADNIIDGLVITSCGMCKLDTNDGGCSLSAKIGEKIYSVQGTNLNAHGDAHGEEGFCNAVRVAWAKGKIVKDVFYADSFSLVGN